MGFIQFVGTTYLEKVPTQEYWLFSALTAEIWVFEVQIASC